MAPRVGSEIRRRECCPSLGGVFEVATSHVPTPSRLQSPPLVELVVAECEDSVTSVDEIQDRLGRARGFDTHLRRSHSDDQAMTFASLRSLSTSSSTDSTMMPALRLGGSATEMIF